MSILKKVSKKLSITITAAVMFLYAVNSVIVSAQNVYEIYSFTGYPQDTMYWCWVAGPETSAKHLVNSSKTQSDAVIEVKGNLVFEGGTIEESAQAANYFTNNKYPYKAYHSSFSHLFLRDQIMRNRLPILGAGEYENGKRKKGHITVGYMISYCSDGKVLIGYYDPSPDRKYICYFNEFCDGNYNYRKYDQTIYTNK